MDFEKRNLFGIDYAIVDYNMATDIILEKAFQKKSFGVSALAVHGLVTSIRSRPVMEKVRSLDMIVPDGQPVRWALNDIHNVGMKDRVYGPTLTLHVLKKAQEAGLNIFLFGSTEKTLSKLKQYILQNFQGLNICGIHVDRFRDASPEEDQRDIETINSSGAHIVLVGRGCPQQEIWVAEHLGHVHAVMMAVGAAFDFLAGTIKQAPPWMQNIGLEWLFRLIQEPKRLWKRYLLTNSYFIGIWLKYRLFSR